VKEGKHTLAGFSKTPKFILRLIHFPPRMAYAIGLGPLVGNFILLLTTTGCKSGRPRVTPLQYEVIDGRIYLGAALGQKADWVRNIQANPSVELRIKSQRFSGIARTVNDPEQIADFLEIRLRLHPKMIGSVLRSDGVPIPPERTDLESYARQLTLVVIEPETGWFPG
jgi:deazaflavin-dependent oxidoreductase (nitroreductase family)